MPKRNKKRIRHQEKVVFVLDSNSQNRNTPKSEDTYNYVRCLIDVMLSKSNVETGTVFVGGSTRDFCMRISGILEFYHFKDIEMYDNTYIFDEDPDFDMPNKFHKGS
jgi:hypothetical protein